VILRKVPIREYTILAVKEVSPVRVLRIAMTTFGTNGN